MQLIQSARQNIRTLLDQCGIKYEVAPFDDVLYQECLADATRRGYPVNGAHAIQIYLRETVVYTATSYGHLPRPTQIWIALLSSALFFVDDAPALFPSQMENIYHFNNRFIRGEPQGSGILDAYADIIRRASELYPPVVSQLIMASTLNSIGGNLLEHETKSMKISAAAQQYSTYQSVLAGASEAYAFMVFPKEIPLNDYIQAIPELAIIVNNVNDVLSFYKEEKAGETTNQISILAARTKKSKLEVYAELTETTIDLHKRIVEILEGNPEACDIYKRWVGGYVRFHTSTPSRYHLDDLDL